MATSINEICEIDIGDGKTFAVGSMGATDSLFVRDAEGKITTYDDYYGPLQHKSHGPYFAFQNDKGIEASKRYAYVIVGARPNRNIYYLVGINCLTGELNVFSKGDSELSQFHEVNTNRFQPLHPDHKDYLYFQLGRHANNPSYRVMAFGCDGTPVIDLMLAQGEDMLGHIFNDRWLTVRKNDNCVAVVSSNGDILKTTPMTNKLQSDVIIDKETSVAS